MGDSLEWFRGNNKRKVDMKHGSLFSGIGGFDLAASWMNWDNVFHCELNPFGRKVLKHYWPTAKSYEDITKTNFNFWRGRIDILTGGFPCQPYSTAGKRKGKEDARHLWPEMLRAIRQIQPRWIVGENVYGLVNWNGGLVFEEVQAELESEGYEVQPVILPACSVNAPHRRDRVWFIAYSIGKLTRKKFKRKRKEYKQKGGSVWSGPSSNGKNGPATNASIIRHKGNDGQQFKFSRTFTAGNWQAFPTVSPICGGNDGIPGELDGITFPKWRNETIKAYGNAIVPQVAFQIFKAIEEYEKLK